MNLSEQFQDKKIDKLQAHVKPTLLTAEGGASALLLLLWRHDWRGILAIWLVNSWFLYYRLKGTLMFDFKRSFDFLLSENQNFIILNTEKVGVF